MKAIPNYISICRIILSLILVFVKPLSTAFYVIYIMCGFSDMIDGFVARKTGTTSRLGEKLDSIADMTMVGVLIIILYPIVNPTTEALIWIILIGGIRLASMVIGLKKYKTFVSLHTYANKLTGLVLFLFPLLLLFFHSTVIIYIICFVASLSAIEELIIQMTSRELQINRPSIFIK